MPVTPVGLSRCFSVVLAHDCTPCPIAEALRTTEVPRILLWSRDAMIGHIVRHFPCFQPRARLLTTLSEPQIVQQVHDAQCYSMILSGVKDHL